MNRAPITHSEINEIWDGLLQGNELMVIRARELLHELADSSSRFDLAMLLQPVKRLAWREDGKR